MKTVTISAFLAILVAIPLMFKKRVPNPVEVRLGETTGSNEETRRYDIDDFLTQ